MLRADSAHLVLGRVVRVGEAGAGHLGVSAIIDLRI